MIFDTRQSDGDWFKFFDSTIDPKTGDIVYYQPQADAAEFCIRSLQPFWEKKLSGRKRESEMVLNPKTEAMERVSYYPEQSYEDSQRDRDDAIDYAITGIRNAFWADGTPIEVIRENKLRLRTIPAFERFLNRVWSILNSAGVSEQNEREVDATRKN